MLPDRLSGDLCSLHEGVERACVAVEMVIDAQGNKLRHRFTRGRHHQPAALNYEEVQAAQDGAPNAKCAPLMEDVITPLYGAYFALRRARAERQPLELDLPERRIVLTDEGEVASVAFKDRLDAHRMIEEFMVLANVAAAEELTQRRQPLLFRVHEEPAPERLEALREVAQASGFVLAKGQVLKTRHLNGLLAQAAESEDSELINLATLRSMQQAYYNPENFGHFGLALRSYTHFTSPIRRYSDLIVHRALITAHVWGDDGLGADDVALLERTAKHISETERRSMTAERDTTDRYLAAFLSDRVGAEFAGRINSVQRFGIFLVLEETGADGLVPIRAIGREFFRYSDKTQTLMGEHSGLVLSVGQPVTVRLAEAEPITGGMQFELLEVDGEALPQGPRRGGGRSRRPGPRRKAEKAKRKAAKTGKKAGAKTGTKSGRKVTRTRK
jgi:ribonuclease R